MNRTINLFEALVLQVQAFQNVDEIIAKQQLLYDLQPYKIQDKQADNLLKRYQEIHDKYYIARTLVIDRDNWNQNERLLFIWFIIFYTYFHQAEQEINTEHFWQQLSAVFFKKRPEFLQFQYLNLVKNNKRLQWTEEEDRMLTHLLNQEKSGRWNLISKRMFYESNRTIFRSPKHCRQRWLNHLDKSKTHGQWTVAEDVGIFRYVRESGKKWSKIVPLLNSARTEHMIKNRYNSLVSKNRTNKKQRQSDIALKVQRNLLKNFDAKANCLSVSPLKSKQQESPLAIEANPTQTIEQKASINISTTDYYVPTGYYLDYNWLLWWNSLIANSNFQCSGTFVESVHNQHLLVGQQSNLAGNEPEME